MAKRATSMSRPPLEEHHRPARLRCLRCSTGTSAVLCPKAIHGQIRFVAVDETPCVIAHRLPRRNVVSIGLDGETMSDTLERLEEKTGRRFENLAEARRLTRATVER